MTNSTTSSHTLITIDSIHNGPAHSGHGGVSGGRFAELIDADAASVRFQAPIPLDEPLWATSENDTMLVSGASGPVASVENPSGQGVEEGSPASFDQVKNEIAEAGGPAAFVHREMWTPTVG
jgi:hypothetical protein